LQREGDVWFRHARDGDAREGIVLDQQIEDRVHRVFVPQLGDFCDGFSLKGQELGILDLADQDGLGAGDLLPFVFPIIGWREHVLADALARGEIFQALEEFGSSAVMGPGRNKGGEAIARRG